MNPHPSRRYTALDRAIGRIDRLLRAATSADSAPRRPNPAKDHPHLPLGGAEQRHSAGLMRVNHTGEVCAQALYMGQALVARDVDLEKFLTDAGAEELDHLLWCRERLRELDSRPSVLDPAWFSASVLIALLAALASDRISLGFVEETEHQVCAHLDGHLERISASDHRSRAIIQAMRDDEADHAARARANGAAALPKLVTAIMSAQAKVMTTIAYRI